MAASAAKVAELEEIPVRSSVSRTGKNLSFEIHNITYDSDKTVEVTTGLDVVLGMQWCEKNGAVSTTAYHLGCDFVVTSNAVTVSTIANNSLVFRIILWGYK